jgi:hypothetical protein
VSYPQGLGMSEGMSLTTILIILVFIALIAAAFFYLRRSRSGTATNRPGVRYQRASGPDIAGPNRAPGTTGTTTGTTTTGGVAGTTRTRRRWGIF